MPAEGRRKTHAKGGPSSFFVARPKYFQMIAIGGSDFDELTMLEEQLARDLANFAIFAA